MGRCLFVTIILMLSIFASAQVNKRDSLNKLLAVSTADTGKVMLFVKIAGLYKTNNMDSSI